MPDTDEFPSLTPKHQAASVAVAPRSAALWRLDPSAGEGGRLARLVSKILALRQPGPGCPAFSGVQVPRWLVRLEGMAGASEPWACCQPLHKNAAQAAVLWRV